MKMTVINLLSPTQPPMVSVEHQGQELLFSINLFDRDRFNKGFDVFESINDYWATLTSIEQGQIFYLYCSFKELFNTIGNKSSISEDLSELSVQLLNLHDYDKVKNWVIYQSSIIIPSDFEIEYVDSIDRPGSRDQTYTRPDYINLLAFAIITKTMIPIWGEYISFTRKSIGLDFKEYYAFRLIQNAKLLETEAFDKLKLYIDLTVAQSRNNSHTILKGISSEDFPMWITALAVIRRLCLGDIRGVDDKTTLVKLVFKYIKQKTKPDDVRTNDIIKEKKTSEIGMDGGDNKISSLERYKIKHELPVGVPVEFEVEMQDSADIAYRLSRTMTDELLERCLASSAKLVHEAILEPQITLAQWIIDPVLPPRGVEYFSEGTLVRMLGITQAVLWSKGYYYLALLATSYAEVHPEIMVAGATGSRALIPADIQAEITRLFPFEYVTGGRKSGYKRVNPAIECINTLTDNFSMYSWIMTADDQFVQQVFKTNYNRRIEIPFDIKIQLARLVIDVAQTAAEATAV